MAMHASFKFSVLHLHFSFCGCRSNSSFAKVLLVTNLQLAKSPVEPLVIWQCSAHTPAIGTAEDPDVKDLLLVCLACSISIV
jgi:hypothetical protein